MRYIFSIMLGISFAACGRPSLGERITKGLCTYEKFKYDEPCITKRLEEK